MPPPGGAPLSPIAAAGWMEPSRRAVRDRTDLAGATCSALVFVRRNGSETRTGAIARVPAAQWALAPCWGWGCGHELLRDRVRCQHADDIGSRTRKLRWFAQCPGS